MTDVRFKIRGRKDELVLYANMSDELDIRIFWRDLSTKAGGTMDWKQQMFLVSAPGQQPLNIVGEDLYEVAMREKRLPPHKEQSTRACKGLAKLPWLIKAKPSAADTATWVDAAAAQTAASGVSSDNAAKKESSEQLPFGIFIREEVRAVIRALPEELKKSDGIQSLLTTEQPDKSARWTPDDCALNHTQAAALGLVANEVSSVASWFETLDIDVQQKHG